MNKVSKIIKWDLISAWRWFLHRPFGKSIVVILFGITLLAVGGSIFVYSYNVLAYLFIQEEFGLIVGDYILALSFFVVFIIGILSSAVASLMSLFHSKQIQNLLFLPINNGELFIAKSIENLVPSMWPVAVILVPVLVAYVAAFGVGNAGIFGIIAAVIALVLLIEAIGVILAMTLARYTKSIKNIVYLVLIGIGVFALPRVVGVLVPKNLLRAYHASTLAEFANEIYSLPIFSKFIITNWMWPSITGYYGYTIVLVSALLGLYMFIGLVVKRYYAGLVVLNQDHRVGYSGGNLKLPRMSSRSLQIVLNDLIALVKGSNFSTYLWFTIFLLAFLVSVTVKIPVLQAREQGWMGLAIAVTWFGYFSLIALISNRFVFTLMAKEYISPYILFSAPISNLRIIGSKLTSALIIMVMPIIVGAYMLSKTGLYYGEVSGAIVMFVVVCTLVALLQFVMGVLNSEIARDGFSESVASGIYSVGSSLFSYAIMIAAIYMHIIGYGEGFVVLWGWVMAFALLLVILVSNQKLKYLAL